MKLLIDENVPGPVARALSNAGFDVVSISEVMSGESDDRVLWFAQLDDRVIVTQDTDFATMGMRDLWEMPGLVLIELSRHSSAGMAERVLNALQEHGSQAAGNIMVVEPTRVRIRQLPDPAG